MNHDVIKTSAADTLPPFEPATLWSHFRHATPTIKGVRLHFVKRRANFIAAGVATELVCVAICDAAPCGRRATRHRARPTWDRRLRPTRVWL